MALNLEGVGTTIVSSYSVTTISGSLTVPVSSEIAIFGIVLIADGGGGISGTPTYGGNNLTRLGTGSRDGSDDVVEVWYLLSPPTGSNTFSLNTVSTTYFIKANVQGWSGIDTGTPFGTVYTNTATSSTPNVTVSDWASPHAALGFVTQQNITASDNTSLYINNAGSENNSASYDLSTGSLSWTTSGSRHWPALGVTLKQASSSAFIKQAGKGGLAGRGGLSGHGGLAA